MSKNSILEVRIPSFAGHTDDWVVAGSQASTLTQNYCVQSRS